VPAASIAGRAQAVVPLAGYLIVILSVPTGVVFVIGLLATLLAAAWLLESVASDPGSRLRPAPAVSQPAREMS
jgi:hypothetical protein